MQISGLVIPPIKGLLHIVCALLGPFVDRFTSPFPPLSSRETFHFPQPRRGVFSLTHRCHTHCYACAHRRIHTCTYLCTCIHSLPCARMHTHAHAYTHTHTYTHSHTHNHTRTHTHTHTHARTNYNTHLHIDRLVVRPLIGLYQRCFPAPRQPTPRIHPEVMTHAYL